MNEKKPQPISPVQRIRPAVQEKIAACHSVDAERALEVAFGKLRADERVREEQLREALRRAGGSPLGKLEPQFGGRARD